MLIVPDLELTACMPVFVFLFTHRYDEIVDNLLLRIIQLDYRGF